MRASAGCGSLTTLKWKVRIDHPNVPTAKSVQRNTDVKYSTRILVELYYANRGKDTGPASQPGARNNVVCSSWEKTDPH